MKDFIITSLQTWDIEIGSTIKNTALEISKQNRVLYINTPMDYSTRPIRRLFCLLKKLNKGAGRKFTDKSVNGQSSTHMFLLICRRGEASPLMTDIRRM
jgi:hypothetical protein